MFWILSSLFNMSVDIVSTIFYIASGVIWLMPIIKNLLLIYSLIRLTSITAVKLHDLCKYIARLEQNKKKKKRRHTVSFVSDNLRNNNFINENRNNKFMNTKDYWNKNQALSSFYSNGDHQLNSKHKKTKSLDQSAFIKRQGKQSRQSNNQRFYKS